MENMKEMIMQIVNDSNAAAKLAAIINKEVSLAHGNADEEDLASEAITALCLAAERSTTPLDSAAFINYAGKYIHGAIVRYVLSQGDVTISATALTQINQARQTVADVGSVQDAATILNCSVEFVENAMKSSAVLAPAERLNRPVSDKDGKETMEAGDMIADSDAFEESESSMVQTRLHSRLEELAGDNKEILDALLAGEAVRKTAKRLGMTEREVQARKAELFLKIRCSDIKKYVA